MAPNFGLLTGANSAVTPTFTTGSTCKPPTHHGVQQLVTPRPPLPCPFQSLAGHHPPDRRLATGHLRSTRAPPCSATDHRCSGPGHAAFSNGSCVFTTRSTPFYNRSLRLPQSAPGTPSPPPEHSPAPARQLSHRRTQRQHPAPQNPAPPRDSPPTAPPPPRTAQNDISPAVKQRGRRLQLLQARAVGFEPTTRRLTAACSTTELHPKIPFLSDGSGEIPDGIDVRQPKIRGGMQNWGRAQGYEGVPSASASAGARVPVGCTTTSSSDCQWAR